MLPPMRLHTIQPVLELNVTLPQVQLDPSAALADIGLRPIGEVMRERAQHAARQRC